MKRLLIGIILAFSVAALAQQPSPPAMRPFTAQQMDNLKILSNQVAFEEARIEAATARRDLARERANGIKKDACHAAGFDLDSCEWATDQAGNPVGVRRIEKAAPKP